MGTTLKKWLRVGLFTVVAVLFAAAGLVALVLGLVAGCVWYWFTLGVSVGGEVTDIAAKSARARWRTAPSDTGDATARCKASGQFKFTAPPGGFTAPSGGAKH